MDPCGRGTCPPREPVRWNDRPRPPDPVSCRVAHDRGRRDSARCRGCAELRARQRTFHRTGARRRAVAESGCPARIEDRGNGRVLVTLLSTIEIDGEAKPALVAESLALLTEEACVETPG